jgi:hypothetical protein
MIVVVLKLIQRALGSTLSGASPTVRSGLMKIGSVLPLALFCLALVPVSAKAVEDDEGRRACMNDALTVCAQFIPDRERIASCLISNRERISAPCRTLLMVHKTSAHER